MTNDLKTISTEDLPTTDDGTIDMSAWSKTMFSDIAKGILNRAEYVDEADVSPERVHAIALTHYRFDPVVRHIARIFRYNMRITQIETERDVQPKDL